jgi:hypothetical protein
MELLKRHIQNCLLHHNQKRDFLINNGTNGSKFNVNTYHIVKIFKSLSVAHNIFFAIRFQNLSCFSQLVFFGLCLKELSGDNEFIVEKR